MKVKNKKFSTIWYENKNVKIIDQTKIPFSFEIKTLKSLSDFCRAIRNMEVRGAPLIGVTAAMGFAISLKKDPRDSNINRSFNKLVDTRPTAVNLKWAIQKIRSGIENKKISERGEIALKLALNIRENDIENCRKIGLNGVKLIKKIFKKTKKRVNILTHCNAGWLATVDYGTALSPIFLAHKESIPIHVWVDETRPRNQGALLTAWELQNEKIPHTVIVDNAGGYLMQNGYVDMCLVGSDRTTGSGDVCNKIGTYLKAISAYENNVPFYVALPSSTIDRNIEFGKDIPIEVRDGEEISKISFKGSNKIVKANIFPKVIKTFNPAFDTTPAKYITKLITEKGLYTAKKSEIKKIFEN